MSSRPHHHRGSRSSSSDDNDSVDSNDEARKRSSRRASRRRSNDHGNNSGEEEVRRRRGGGGEAAASESRSGRRPRGNKPSSGGGADAEHDATVDAATVTSENSKNTVTSRVSMFEEHISKSKSADSSSRNKHGGDDDATLSSRQSAATTSRKGGSAKKKVPSSSGAADEAAFSPRGFGGFPSSFSPSGQQKKDAAAAAFGNLDDMGAFSPAATTTSGTGSGEGKTNTGAAFSSSAAFDAAFATEPVFGAKNMETTTADFDPTAFGGSGGFEAFDQTPSFPAQPETVWDKTPLTDVPKVEPERLVLRQKPVLTKAFRGRPVNNPLNGNVVFAAATTSGGVHLHEIDPSRNFIQVAAAPIFTAAMREKIASKYGATVCAVEDVGRMACGVQTTGRQARVRVAAIVDLKILESSGTMRVVAVWQWSNLQQLMYVLTPPSGGDFAYDPTTLQVSEGLCFLAGSSSKGACVFVSKPAVREAWSANFLTGSGTVSAMSVAPNRPYLVVALTDKSVTVWTYKSALVRDSTKAQTSKRWLFPLCRLSYAKAMATERAASPGPDYKDSAAGKNGEFVCCTVQAACACQLCLQEGHKRLISSSFDL